MKGQITELKDRAGAMLCVNGTCEALINGKPYQIRRGMICIISPIITFFPISQSPDYAAQYLIDSLEVFYPVMKSVFDIIVQLRINNAPCRMLDETNINIFIEHTKRIEEKKQRIESTVDKNEKTLLEKTLKLLKQETMMELISLYYNSHAVEPHPISKDEIVVFDFVYEMNKNYKSERTVNYYANRANLSKGHFSRIIKNRTGKTPSQWIATVTIVNAKLMLEQSGNSIKEIAAELNFPEQFTFRKYFKQHVGVPPKEYRALKRNSRTNEQQG